ncbi:MAG: energy transducer TonB [Candidatus Omnitrophica bacterium]|nr:energy transducer TonB [Candidatus Omnitrophota bacterium]
MNFKAAVFCSAAIHAGFLVLRPPAALAPPRKTLYPLEVSYVVLAPPERSPDRSRGFAPRRYSAALTPHPGPGPTPAKPVSEPAQARKPSPQREEPPLPKPLETLKQPETTSQLEKTPPSSSIPVSGAAAVPDGEYAAIRHKERVREHLRKKLYYPETSLDGVVRLKVVLRPDGSLKDALVSEASDARLAAFALRDARSAGRYPPFPRDMASDEAAYEFLVQYRQGDSSL